MTKTPLVSICCITYNHEKFIGNAIEGFLKQETDFPIEIIIHDDASTDNTASSIRKYENEYPELIKPIFQQENQYSKGISPSPKFVWPKARGKYIAMCEGDDYWTDPLKLQKQVKYMEMNERCVLTYHPFINDLVGNSSKDFDYYEPIGKELLRPRTLTLMFRNLLEDYPAGLLKAPNGDQALKFYLSQYGDFKPIMDIKPSIRRIHGGGVMSLQSKKVRLERGLKTWQTIYETYSESEESSYLQKKVQGFQSSLKWLKFKNSMEFKDFSGAILHDLNYGVLVRKIRYKTLSLLLKPLVFLKESYLNLVKSNY